MRVAFFYLAVASSLRVQSPVEKVVELVKELKAKIEADGEIEEKIYNKFACWCESSTMRTAESMKSCKSTIASTTTSILTLKGQVETLAHDISVLESKIQDTEKAQAEETSIREKENKEYNADKEYMETTLSSLQNAMNTLSGAGTGGDVGLLTAASKVRTAVLNARRLSALSVTQAATLRKFLDSPAEAAEGEVDAVAAQKKSSYSPQSATIQGILKDMYDTFAKDLQTANEDESTKQKTYEDWMAVKNEEVAAFKQSSATKDGEKSEAAGTLAEKNQLLDDTTAQLKKDEAFFAQARDSCKSKSDEWDECKRLRTEELSGVNKALDILTSDDARSTFESSTSTRAIDTFGAGDVAFVQVSSTHARAAEKASRILSKTAHDQHNVRLALLASKIRATTTGHFDVVVESIDKQVANLHEEEQADINQRDWCIEERDVNNNNKEQLEYDMDNLEANLEKLANKKAFLEDYIAKTIQEMVDANNTLEAATEDRNDEHQAHNLASADDAKAVSLIEGAIAALSSYGDSNPSFLQKEPVFEVSEDQAPDATFSESGSHGGSTGSIVTLLNVIKEDLQKEMGEADASEEKAQQTWKSLKEETEEFIVAGTKKKVNLEADVAETVDNINADEELHNNRDREHQAVVKYLNSIKSNCDFIMESFEDRYEKRKAELEGLANARATLLGATGMGFLQKH